MSEMNLFYISKLLSDLGNIIHGYQEVAEDAKTAEGKKAFQDLKEDLVKYTKN